MKKFLIALSVVATGILIGLLYFPIKRKTRKYIDATDVRKEREYISLR